MLPQLEQKNKIDEACKRYKKIHQSNQIKFKKLDNWLDKESKMFEKEINIDKKTFKKFERGQIVKVDFGINIGSELSYTHFAIIITKKDSIYSDNITVIPITSKKGNNRILLGKILHLMYPNSSKYNLRCYANISQIKTISKSRIFRNNKKSVLNNHLLNKIDNELINNFTNFKIKC